MIEELKLIVGSDEKILYEGKPNKKKYRQTFIQI